MNTRGIKKLKRKPSSANMVRLFSGQGYTVYWKGRAAPKRRGAKKASPPKPKAWANLVVFLDDTSKRKRSFHLSWNGGRFAGSTEFYRLESDEPALLGVLENALPDWYDRIIRPDRRTTTAEDDLRALLATCS